jgi:hypothetical protein
MKLVRTTIGFSNFRMFTFNTVVGWETSFEKAQWINSEYSHGGMCLDHRKSLFLL